MKRVLLVLLFVVGYANSFEQQIGSGRELSLSTDIDGNPVFSCGGLIGVC